MQIRVFSSWTGLRIQIWGRSFPPGESDLALQLPWRGSAQENYKDNPLSQQIPCRAERYSVLVRLLCLEYHLNLWLIHILVLDELEVSQQEEIPSMLIQLVIVHYSISINCLTPYYYTELSSLNCTVLDPVTADTAGKERSQIT